MYYRPNNSIRRHCEHKHLEIKQFYTLHNLWQVVQNVYFAKSQEKPHKRSIFKRFGLSVPNLRKQNLARIRFRMTQQILHGEPAFLKQSPLGLYRVVNMHYYYFSSFFSFPFSHLRFQCKFSCLNILRVVFSLPGAYFKSKVYSGGSSAYSAFNIPQSS